MKMSSLEVPKVEEPYALFAVMDNPPLNLVIKGDNGKPIADSNEQLKIYPK